MFVYSVFGKRMYFLLLLYFDSAVKYNFLKIFYPDSIYLFKLFRYGKHLRLGLIRYFLSLNVPKNIRKSGISVQNYFITRIIYSQDI